MGWWGGGLPACLGVDVVGCWVGCGVFNGGGGGLLAGLSGDATVAAFTRAHVPMRLDIAVRITVLSDVVAVVASRPDMVMDDVTPIVSAVVGLNVVG